jgi:TRAP transporter TAXI family solute receptor
MTRVNRRSLLAAVPALALAGRPALAQRMKVTLGTASTGGTFAVYGAAFVDALKAIDPTLEIRPMATQGTAENVPRLEAGEIDIGLVSGEVTHELLLGIGRPASKLKVLTAMYSTAGMFVVRADSRYRHIDDLKGRPIVLNARGSGLAIQARYVMDGLGLDIEKDFEPVYIKDLADGPLMVIEGRAAALWGGGLRWPGFVSVASTTRGGRFVVPDSNEIERIQSKHGFLKKLTVPAGLYPGQYDPIVTLGTWSYILARADLDDAVGYRLAKTLYRIERLGSPPRQLAETTVKNTLSAIPGPKALHPGVLQFYKEAELVK